jgi:hypothetical protein
MSFHWGRFGEHADALKSNTQRLDQALADGLRPPARLSVSQWAARYRCFPDDDAFAA